MPNRPGRLRGAFSDLDFGLRARDQLLRLARLRQFALLAYCLMPDHVQILARGQTCDASLRSFVLSWNTWTAHEWRRNHHCRLWQPGYHDHVMREDEADLGVARYIILNPVRAGLVETPEDYPLVGSTEYSLAEILRAADEWLPQW